MKALQLYIEPLSQNDDPQLIFQIDLLALPLSQVLTHEAIALDENCVKA